MAVWLLQLIERSRQSANETKLAAFESSVGLETVSARVRAYLRRGAHELGLSYGTPRQLLGAVEGEAPEERLLRAVIGCWMQLALDTSHLVGRPLSATHLLSLLAAYSGDYDIAEILWAQSDIKVAQKHARHVEQLLERRSLSIAGDPSFGLVLHNGALRVDTRLWAATVRLVLMSNEVDAPKLARLAEAAARQKATLVRVLLAGRLSAAVPSYAAKRAIVRQIEDLQLPPVLEKSTLAEVRRALDGAGTKSLIDLHGVSRRTQRFLVEQAVLASIVSGSISAPESTYIASLASQFGLSVDELRAMELAMAEFYAIHRDVVDVFRVSKGASRLSEELFSSVAQSLEKNKRSILKEIAQTKELSSILRKASRGDVLTPEEKSLMRAQLLDLAKVIPALAIFAAPGGMFLLVALEKFLPIQLLPSAFYDEESPKKKATTK